MKKRRILSCIALVLCLVLPLGIFTSCGDEETAASYDNTYEFSEFEWPSSDIASLIPVPESNIGCIDWEHDYGFVIYVAETTKEDYAAYVSACEDAGFTYDYSKGDDYFWADNEDGYKVHVRYEGDDVMFIRMDAPEEESSVSLETEILSSQEEESSLLLEAEASSSEEEETSTNQKITEESVPAVSSVSFELDSVPEYSDSPYAVINNNVPYFTDAELTTTSYEYYSDLDSTGRCGVAVACIGQDLMPTEERGSIGAVKPTGWHTVKYEIIDGNYLYNRCHLIGYQLSGENANEKNLITGTRYLNVEGMLPFENMVNDYVEETNNHVLYRVTPVFDGDNLVASGVLMEAMSVEDNGGDILFCVYCYNVQPGIGIDYATGDSWLEEGSSSNESEKSSSENTTVDNSDSTNNSADSGTTYTYILNTNTMKFHYSTCSSVKQMSDKNKQEYTGSREDLISQGYEPCKRCNP